MADTCTVWASSADVCPPCSDVYDLDAALLDDMLEVASDILFHLSGSRWPGTCTKTVRPCAQHYVAESYWSDGRTRTYCSCRPESCSCCRLPAIGLGVIPVTAVSSVKVRESKGAALLTLVSGTDYRVDDQQWLVRLGENNSWPCCQDLLQDEGGDGVYFEVTFSYGQAPPPAGVKAAAELACELTLACDPETAEHCRIPVGNISQITRQGVSMTFIEPDSVIGLLSNLPLTSLFLKTYNSAGLRRPPVVINPAHVRPWTEVNT